MRYCPACPERAYWSSTWAPRYLPDCAELGVLVWGGTSCTSAQNVVGQGHPRQRCLGWPCLFPSPGRRYACDNVPYRYHHNGQVPGRADAGPLSQGRELLPWGQQLPALGGPSRAADTPWQAGHLALAHAPPRDTDTRLFGLYRRRLPRKVGDDCLREQPRRADLHVQRVQAHL